MSKEAMNLALEAAYLAGWNASGEGYNAEYPFGDHARNPEEDAAWIKDRDNALRKALAEQPAQTATYTCGVCGVSMQMEQPAQQEPVNEGWKLVPVEPTEDMWKAVNKLDDEMAAGSYDGKGCSIEQAWNCLLDAAPTPPAQRTWVGLTNNELQPIADEYRILFGSWVEDFARAIEAKLRSKNEDRN